MIHAAIVYYYLQISTLFLNLVTVVANIFNIYLIKKVRLPGNLKILIKFVNQKV